MSHKLIVGTTLSGKSTLARAFVKDAVAHEILPVIYDPLESDAWGCDLVTGDEDYFFDYIREGHAAGLKMFAVMDEADTLLTMAHRHNWWVLTRSRHFGIEACVITQYPKLVAPVVRNQCANEIYSFNLNRDAAIELANDFNAEGLRAAPSLMQGEFLRASWVNKQKVVDKFRIF